MYYVSVLSVLRNTVLSWSRWNTVFSAAAGSKCPFFLLVDGTEYYQIYLLSYNIKGSLLEIRWTKKLHSIFSASPTRKESTSLIQPKYTLLERVKRWWARLLSSLDGQDLHSLSRLNCTGEEKVIELPLRVFTGWLKVSMNAVYRESTSLKERTHHFNACNWYWDSFEFKSIS